MAKAGITQLELGVLRANMRICTSVLRNGFDRPDVKVTIIVRAPEALPDEALISTNDSPELACDALTHFARSPRDQ